MPEPTRLAVSSAPADSTSCPLRMSCPCRPMFCPAAAAANSWTASPLAAVSSTITTASAPSGIGAPVATSLQRPAATTCIGIWPV